MNTIIRIKELSICNHPKLTGINDLKIFKNLKVLKASNNSISFSNLYFKYLKVLDLSHNKITTMPSMKYL